MLILYDFMQKIENNKSENEESLSRALDRASLIVYKTNVFPILSFVFRKKSSFI